MPVKLLFENPSERAIYLIHQLQDSLEHNEDKAHEDNELTTRQLVMLIAIKTLPDPVTPTDVARLLTRKTSGITLMIDRMVKENLITRVFDLNDRRFLRLTLTPKGEEKLKTGRQTQKILFDDIMACLDPEELQEFNRLTDKILVRTFELRKQKALLEEIKLS